MLPMALKKVLPTCFLWQDGYEIASMTPLWPFGCRQVADNRQPQATNHFDRIKLRVAATSVPSAVQSRRLSPAG